MIREADTANRFVEEMNHERQYRQHMKTMAGLKPTLDTHYDAPAKYRKDKGANHRVRIFDGKKAVKKTEQDVDSLIEKKKPVEFNIMSARPAERKFKLTDSKITKPAPAEKKRAQTARPAASRPVSSAAKVSPKTTQKKDDLIRKKAEPAEIPSARKRTTSKIPKTTEKRKLVNSPAKPEPVREVQKPAVIEEYQVTHGLDMWDTSDDEDEDEETQQPTAAPVLFEDADFDYSDEI